MNKDLNSIKWDQCLKHCEAEIAWHKFKSILFKFTNKHIPTVTIKDSDQPPWFDNETYKLCRKKERLRAKFKHTKSSTDYANFLSVGKSIKLSVYITHNPSMKFPHIVVIYGFYIEDHILKKS